MAKKRNASATKLTILTQAATLFSEHGFMAMGMDELASRCDISKAAIYYHYKDKESLYEVVLGNMLEALVQTMHERIRETDTYARQLRTFVRTYAEYAKENRALPAILMREIASGGISMPSSAKALMLQLLSMLRRILGSGNESGEFSSVDPMMTHFMIIGSLNFYITSEPMRLKLDQADEKTQEVVTKNSIEDAAEHVADLICQALTKHTTKGNDQ